MHLRDACGAELAAVTTVVDLAGKRILELGCGKGRLTKAVAMHASEVCFLEADGQCTPKATMPLERELRQHVRCAVHDADALDVERRRFDLALCGWSL
jgi:16S rRNA A1518/A1519 N6-dimethyltransferase RsmA/KsgA/DIM1 with predicted DNA glycosylase/AP lyase activity